MKVVVKKLNKVLWWATIDYTLQNSQLGYTQHSCSGRTRKWVIKQLREKVLKHTKQAYAEWVLVEQFMEKEK